MKLEDLNNRLSKIDLYFRSVDETSTEKERLLSRIVKLNEEVGELCEAALCENDINQRPKDKEIDFDAELADVLICTLLLAHNRSKDVWVEVENKLTKQFKRLNLE